LETIKQGGGASARVADAKCLGWESEVGMLSKCLNPRCSAKFRYLRQGQLYRIDFLEAQRRLAFANGERAVSLHGRRECVEHFWLCEECAKKLTIEADAEGEVRLVARGAAAQGPAKAPGRRTRVMVADAS
jgi:hypothetical protein